MASTRDYIDYLNDQVDIAPANSQEELQAAELIQKVMQQHGLDARLQEFEASTGGNLPYRILLILLFVGVVMAGFYNTPVAAVGVTIVIVCGVLFLLERLGYNFLSNLGRRARSQNVVGVHHAEGPLVVKGNRPIVIVAHYDTPRESLLYHPSVVRYQSLIKTIAPACIGVVCVLGIFQSFGFMPVAARRVLWVLDLIAALPLLFLGVDAIYERFSAYTEGANDNKASVAAMLGVLDKVRPGEDAATGYAKTTADKQRKAKAARLAAAAEQRDAAAKRTPESVSEPVPRAVPAVSAPEPAPAPAAESRVSADTNGFEQLDESEVLAAYGETVEEEPAAADGASDLAEIEPRADEVSADTAEAAEDESFIPSFVRGDVSEQAAEQAVEQAVEEEPVVLPQVVTEHYEKIEGVRHGASVIEGLHMLPDDCEIEYVEPQLLSRSVRPQDALDLEGFGLLNVFL